MATEQKCSRREKPKKKKTKIEIHRKLNKDALKTARIYPFLVRSQFKIQLRRTEKLLMGNVEEHAFRIRSNADCTNNGGVLRRLTRRTADTTIMCALRSNLFFETGDGIIFITASAWKMSGFWHIRSAVYIEFAVCIPRTSRRIFIL